MNTLKTTIWGASPASIAALFAGVFISFMTASGLHAQLTPTPVPQYFYEWTGAQDNNFFNVSNWTYSGTDAVPSTPAVPPSGSVTSINLPAEASSKLIDFTYNGTGTERFTFYSIQTGLSKNYSIIFSGNENGWLEINPVGKGFSAAGTLANAQNPNSNGNNTTGRNQFYVTLNPYTRLVLDDSLSSLLKAENGLTAGLFTLRGNAEMNLTNPGSGGYFVLSNSTAFNPEASLQIGAILFTDPGTVVNGGTWALNLQSKLSGGEVTNMAGLITFDTTTTGTDGRLVSAAKNHQIYGPMTVTGTVVSPGTFYIRGNARIQYYVDGLHQGPITIDNAGSLGGTGVVVANQFESTGKITVNRGGIITPATKGTAAHKDHPLTIVGDVLLYGTLSFDLVTEDYYDWLVINGNLDIPATSASSTPTLAVGRAETFPLIAGTYRLLTVSGTINGNFDEANVSLPVSLSLRPSWRWVGNTLEVSFEQLPFASDPSLTGLYRATAERVDAVFGMGLVNDILFDTLNRQPSAILFKDVLYQLSPSTYQAWFPGAIFRTNSMVQDIEDMQYQDAAYKRKKGSVQTFLRGYRQEASRARNEMATYSNYGTIATMFGADYAIGENFVAGGFINYEKSDFDLDTEGGESNADSYTFGIKARYLMDKFQFNLAAFYGTDDYESTRTVAKTNLATWANSDTSGSRLGAALSAAYTFSFPWFEVAPAIGMQWLNWEVDGFRERNANEASLYVYKQKETSLQSKAGVRIARSVETKYGHIRPYFHYAWVHEFNNGARTISADLFGGRIDIEAPGSHSDGYRLDFGLDFDVGRNLRMDVHYVSENRTAVDESRGFHMGVSWTF
jgi:uncharacterized protein YhjY with autotransporter beta-barrel domain